MKQFVFLVMVIIMPIRLSAATLSGFITDGSNGESLPYASVVLSFRGQPLMGTVSNVDGYFSIHPVPVDTTCQLTISYIGFLSFEDIIEISKKEDVIRLDVQLKPSPITTSEIIVEADRDKEERLIQPGFIEVEVEEIREMPAFGEADILRSLHLLPGIQTASDMSSGLYIRGGGPDQTLILLDQIPLYNPSHAFGFFSTFNPDAIKDLILYKGAYPAQYGGRLNSVLDVRNKDGNRKEFQGTGGVSLIASRLTLEGPIKKGSWMVSGRRTYLDPILSFLRRREPNVPAYYFFDLNGKWNKDFSDSEKLQFSGYFGRDDMVLDIDGSNVSGGFRWGNAGFTGKWTHVFSPSIYGNFIVSRSKYRSNTEFDIFDTPVQFENSIRDLTFKGDVDYFVTMDHVLGGGGVLTFYDFKFQTKFNKEEQLNLQEKSRLISLYLQDDWRPGSNTHIRIGARGNFFSEGGWYQLEPRFSISHGISSNWRLKIASGLYHQYLQMVNTELFSGGDFWVPLDETVNPGRSFQAVVGLNWEPSLLYQFVIEGYFTDLENLVVLDTRVAADSEGTTSEEAFMTGGTGYATGIELFFQRRIGALTGWIGYTLGLTRRKFSELNDGDEFSPKYDRRHDISFVTHYKMGKWSLGVNFVYGTGQAFTPASAQYILRSPALPELEEFELPLAATRNSSRLLPYHRLDFSVRRQFEILGIEPEVYLQIFNLYSRRNEWFVQYKIDDQDREYKVAKMLPVVPTLGIDFKF